MTSKYTPRYFITELNNGIQWITDGQDFGMRADAAPELLDALMFERQISLGNDPEAYPQFIEMRDKAIKAAKGNA